MRAVEIALRLIEQIAENQPAGASDLARELNLPKATVHRSLLTLERSGWIERLDDGRTRWMLSLKPLTVGGQAIEARRGLRMAALPVMEALRRATEETVQLSVLDADSIVLIERFDGLRSSRAFIPFGKRWDLHRSSAGKAVLANLPLEARQAYLAKPLLRRRSTELMDPAELEAELELTRTRGFAMTLGAKPPDTNTVGAAIFDKRGHPFAAISISGPAERLLADDCLRLAPQVMDAAERISIGMSAA